MKNGIPYQPDDEPASPAPSIFDFVDDPASLYDMWCAGNFTPAEAQQYLDQLQQQPESPYVVVPRAMWNEIVTRAAQLAPTSGANVARSGAKEPTKRVSLADVGVRKNGGNCPWPECHWHNRTFTRPVDRTNHLRIRHEGKEPS